MSNAGQMYAVIAAGLRSEIICEVFPGGMIVLEDVDTPLFSAEPQVINMDYRLIEDAPVDLSYYEKPARRSGQKTRPHWPNQRRRK